MRQRWRKKHGKGKHHKGKHKGKGFQRVATMTADQFREEQDDAEEAGGLTQITEEEHDGGEEHDVENAATQSADSFARRVVGGRATAEADAFVAAASSPMDESGADDTQSGVYKKYKAAVKVAHKGPEKVKFRSDSFDFMVVGYGDE